LAAANHCLPTREHRDSDYTPGGLYAPGVADSAPAGNVDLSGVIEPVPRVEPRSRYGNRSPYTVLGKSYRVRDSAEGYVERGVASWYGSKFNGRSTSSGEIYDMCAFSAAHKTLPLPSFVRVTNLDNGRSVIVRVNDRGPFHDGRLIDLSYAAAVRLGVDRTGTARVELRAITGEGEASADAAPFVATPLSPASRGNDSGGRRIVQVGSFAEKDNARRLADRLDDAGIDDVDLDRAEVDGRDVWRVRVGPLDADEVEAVLARIRALGLPNPRVFSE
jgi:rare lipoprotein A